MNKQTRILVVDDNQDLAKNIRDILQEKDYAVSVAFNGNTAINMCSLEKFDLAIVDYKLPDMDGLQLQERLSAFMDADVIIITGHASLQSAAEAVHRKRIVGYETKPLDMGRLLAFIEQVVERRRAEEASRNSRWELDIIFNSVRALIWQKDRNGKYLQVNRAYCETVGIPREEIIGKSDYDLFPFDIAEHYVKYDQKVMDSGKPECGIEEPHQRPSGERGWSLTDKLLYHNGKENIAGTIGFALDITERKRSEEQIKASLKEKEALLRELNHRVKNNLMAICSLISLQSYQTKDPHTLSLLNGLDNRVMSMAYVHEEIYQAENFAKIDFSPYLERLITSIYQHFTRQFVDIKIDVENIFLEVEKAVTCGLLTAELAANAFKHAFPEDSLFSSLVEDGREEEYTPELRIEMRQEGDCYILIVSDNGVGLPQGVDPHQPVTLGMTLVKSWAEHQLGGKLEMESGKGTRFIITFKDKYR
jgi:PAS domain S-box-containing protein